MVNTLMRPLTALLLVGSLATGSAASAAEGLYLTWNDCALGPGAAHDVTNACASNLDEQKLFCAFTVPALVDSVLGVQLVLDLQHSEASLPDWWRFAAADCRAGELRVNFDFTSQSGCSDVFQGLAGGLLLGYYVTEPRGGGNQARIFVAASRLPDHGYMQFDPGVMYYGARLAISNVGTVAPQAVCAGCSGSACLVLNSVLIQRQPGAVGGDVFIGQSGPDNANFATWQGGSIEGCRTVPVRAVTWGRVKSLYR
jgi:hypothetical protein